MQLYFLGERDVRAFENILILERKKKREKEARAVELSGGGR